MAENHDDMADRIVHFLKDLYFTALTQDLREAFNSFEAELKHILLGRQGELPGAAAWVKALTDGAPQTNNAINIVVDRATVPDLIGTLFAILAEKASLGLDNSSFRRFVPLAQSQLISPRAVAMRSVVSTNFSAPVTALEIGTWFGLGSTQLWFAILPPGSSLFLVDSWRSYIRPEDTASDTPLSFRVMQFVPQAALASTMREVFKQEARADNAIDVFTLRGQSSKLLKYLQEGTFDLIYIDGSHYYDDVKSDIVRAKRLARSDFSIVCGDDLETLDPALIDAARAHPNRDYISIDGVGFHPGVTRAVSEEFERVNVSDGFWWVVRRRGIWGI